MEYSQEFKEKFLKHFKGQNYEKMLENGSPWVGRYIEDTLHGLIVGFSHENVVAAYEERNSDVLNNVYLQSKKIVELKDLNREFKNLNNPESIKEEMRE